MSLHANYPPVVAIHAAFCAATRVSLELNFEREACWMAWLKHNWTADDLRLVVKHLNRKILIGERRSESLMFRNLVRDTTRFEEDLSFFRAQDRVKRPDRGRAAVLEATGRPAIVPKETARSVGDIMAAEQAFEAFRALKETL